VTDLQLPSAPRLLIQAQLVPVQGRRFQPTGFPDLGAARFSTPTEKMLLVESAQSVANRMEGVCWDDERNDVVEALQGLPYVRVVQDDRPLTSSLLEAHRLNSVYIENSDFGPTLKAEIGYEKDKPLDRDRLVRAICKYDPNALLHGVFLESIAGVLRIPRALSGFIEATGVDEVASGGVKNDLVQAGGDKDAGRTAKAGYGNVPFHRVEFTAERIDAYFNLDLAQLRSYRLKPATTKLLYALAIYKIRAFLDRGLRLRTACDFDVQGDVVVTRPKDHVLPTEAEAVTALKELLPAAAKEGSFSVPAVTVAKYAPAKKATVEQDDSEGRDPAPPAAKKATRKKGS
jgi:CRISPR-associated protein Csb1